MKNIKALLFGRDARINGLFAVLIVASIALGCTCGDFGELGKQDESKSNRSAGNKERAESEDKDTADGREDGDVDGRETEDPDDSGSPSKTMIDGLVRSMTSEFASGVAAGDLSDFYKNALSDELKEEFSEAKFKSTFSGFTDKKELASALLRDALSAE